MHVFAHLKNFFSKCLPGKVTDTDTIIDNLVFEKKLDDSRICSCSKTSFDDGIYCGKCELYICQQHVKSRHITCICGSKGSINCKSCKYCKSSLEGEKCNVCHVMLCPKCKFLNNNILSCKRHYKIDNEIVK
jgi:hypothetical protein